MNTAGQATLGDDLEGCLGGRAERINVGYVGLEVVCVGRVVLLHFRLTSLFRENVKDLSRPDRQHILSEHRRAQEILETHHSDATLGNDCPGCGAAD